MTAKKEDVIERITTGLQPLDKLLNGGFPQKTVVLLSGGAGTGKTLFGMNFLIDGAAKGEKCCYVTLNEDREELLKACQNIESLRKVGAYIDKNLVIERIIMGGKINLEYFTKMFAAYPKIDRLVIDNVNKLLIFAENKRDYRMHLAELIRYLKQKIGCTLLICETAKDNIDSGDCEAFEADGILHIIFSELEERPLRMLEIYKMRYTAFEPRIRYNLIIGDKGLKLSTTKVI